MLHLFQKHGLNPQFIRFQSGAASSAAYRSGSVDIGFTGMPGFTSAQLNGSNLNIFAMEANDASSLSLVAEPGSGINSVKDLAGKTVGTAAGTVVGVGLQLALQRALRGRISAVRSLYSGHQGPLYQVTRASDSRSLDIRPLPPGGTSDAAAQDDFCAGTSCTITEIYDQSPRHNDLTIEGPGPYSGFRGVPDVGAPAAALPVRIQGRKAYGVRISAFTGYRDNHTTGAAVHGQPESMYMVTLDPLNYSIRCVRFSPCFKGGNAQSGCLATNYAGHLPAIQGGGYSPMQQEGAIVLGTGGDNSNQGVGYFFEGVMTAGVPSNAADNAVQANIVSAGYGRSGPGYPHPAPQSHCTS